MGNSKARKIAEERLYYQKRPFEFIEEKMKLTKAGCLDSLLDKVIEYKSKDGTMKRIKLFDKNGELVCHDLKRYTVKMFKGQENIYWNKNLRGQELTWQQTVIIEAYQRALETFDQDSFDAILRQITVASGNGISKSSTMSIIIIHFLYCFDGSNIGVTANTENQVKDVIMKEIAIWIRRLPEYMQEQYEQQDKDIKMPGQKDWWLRARVSQTGSSQALAGLHAKYVLAIVDEASGIEREVFESMKGAATDKNYIFFYMGNPMKGEGEFYDSHTSKKHLYQNLTFDSRDSPLVTKVFEDKIKNEYGIGSDEWRFKITGQFPDPGLLDDKGFIQLFANTKINFAPESAFTKLVNPILGVDPAGAGKDKTMVTARDELSMKNIFREAMSEPRELAGKIESLAAMFNTYISDINIDAFGVGAIVANEVRPPKGTFGTCRAVLTDKPRDDEDAKARFYNYKAELMWRFYEWVRNGGVIITNNPEEWRRELMNIKYRREGGKIKLQTKVEFKKEFGYSPDLTDSAIYTFINDKPYRPVVAAAGSVGNNRQVARTMIKYDRKAQEEDLY